MQSKPGTASMGEAPPRKPVELQTSVDREPPWEHLGISKDPGPIRLGEDRKRVLSLDDSHPARRLADPAEPDADRMRLAIADFDWLRFARELGFSTIERAVFRAYFERGIPAYRLSEKLGITPQQARVTLGAVRARLAREDTRAYINAGRFDSLKLGYVSHGCSYELAMLPDLFQEIMASEKLFSLYFQRHPGERPGEFGKTGVFHPREVETQMTIEQQHLKRGSEAAKLSRLSERAHLQNVACEDAERALQVTEDGFRAEQAQAMLDEQEWPSRATEKILQAAQAKLSAARLSLQAARDAARKQSEICAQSMESSKRGEWRRSGLRWNRNGCV